MYVYMYKNVNEKEFINFRERKGRIYMGDFGGRKGKTEIF